jgi:hypothetical protein
MQVAVAFRPWPRLNGGATSTMGAIVKVSRENLALAVLWGAISACALITVIAPKMTAPGAVNFTFDSHMQQALLSNVKF